MIISGDTLANIMAVAQTANAAPAREVRLRPELVEQILREHPGRTWEQVAPASPLFVITSDLPSFPGFQVHRLLV